MYRTNIYLDERQTQAMDEVAAREGVSRAEIVRRLIDRGLGSGQTGPDVATAITQSFGVARDIELPDRTRTQRDGYLAEMWQQ